MNTTARNVLSLLTTLLVGSLAQGARYPLLGGPGLVHVQSAKTGLGLSYRTFNAASSYGNVNYYGMTGKQDALTDVWTYHSIGYAPNGSMAVMLTGMAHGESWAVKNASPLAANGDKSLGCPGDGFLSGKYHFSPNEMFDLAVEPMVSIPMDLKKYQDSPSQTGKLDVGGKALCDINLGPATMYVNAGFLTRGAERPMVPVGLGLEYGFNEMFSAYAEASGELRMGSQKDAYPDSLVPQGRGFDRTEFRVTPGVRFAPFAYGAVNLSADIGLTHSAAPWQVIFGIDIPAAAGRFLSTSILGAIAGLIKDRDNGIPMKGMITFPGSDVPGVVSDEMGKYLARLNPGEYKIHIYANGYRWIERKIQVKAGKDEKWDLTLKRKLGTIAGKVIDGASGLPLTATLQFVNARLPDLTSDGNSGEFTTLVPPGKYKLVAKADGYADKEIDLAIKDKENQTPQFVMSPAGMAPPAPAIETTVASLPPATASAEPRLPAPPPRPRPVRVTTPATTAAPAAVKPAAAKPAVSAKLTAADVAALYKTGVEQFMNEDYATAQSTFQKVLKSDPGNAKAKEYLGKTKDRLKKLKG